MEILKEILEDVEKLLKTASKDASNRVGSASRRAIRHRAIGRKNALFDIKRHIEKKIEILETLEEGKVKETGDGGDRSE